MKARGMIVPAEPAPGCDRIKVEIWQNDRFDAPTIVEIRRDGPVGKTMRFTVDEAWALSAALALLLTDWQNEATASHESD